MAKSGSTRRAGARLGAVLIALGALAAGVTATAAGARAGAGTAPSVQQTALRWVQAGIAAVG